MVARECPRLEHLNLSFCTGLTADAVRAIEKGFPQLQSLRFAADDCTSAAATELCDSRPHLTSGVQFNPCINLTTVSQNGGKIFFKCKYATPLGKLMQAWCTNQSVRMSSVRFLFDGTRINEDMRPFELEMEDGDTIDVMLEQVARDWAPPVTPPSAALASTVAERLLCGELQASSFSEEAARAIEAGVTPLTSRPGRAGMVVEEQLLSAAQCSALVWHADLRHASILATTSAAACADLKLALTLGQLSLLLGAGAAASLVEFGAAALSASMPQPPWASRMAQPTLLLRRRDAVEAADRSARIAFHRDQPRVVLNVALNTGFVGGQLIYLVPGGGIVVPERPVGRGIALDNAVVHGVSSLEAGVRYTLLASFMWCAA